LKGVVRGHATFVAERAYKRLSGRRVSGLRRSPIGMPVAYRREQGGARN